MFTLCARSTLFFFNDTATTEIYTLSLHDALPISGLTPALGANGAALGLLCAWLVDDRRAAARGDDRGNDLIGVWVIAAAPALDRKSTRPNSRHAHMSYDAFCLQKKQDHTYERPLL